MSRKPDLLGLYVNLQFTEAFGLPAKIQDTPYEYQINNIFLVYVCPK